MKNKQTVEQLTLSEGPGVVMNVSGGRFISAANAREGGNGGPVTGVEAETGEASFPSPLSPPFSSMPFSFDGGGPGVGVEAGGGNGGGGRARGWGAAAAA
jgi:hypothetical protein